MIFAVCHITVADGNFVSSSQIMGIKVKHRKNKPEAAIVAEYFADLDYWLDKNYDGLQKHSDWEKFYVQLVHTLVALTNEKYPNELQIDPSYVVMPTKKYIFQACRLMYQAIGKLRTAFADGQHRMASIIKLFTGWESKVQPRKSPPRAFVKGYHAGIAETEPESKVMDTNEDSLAAKFDKVLETMDCKVIVRVFTPLTGELEAQSQAYSNIRMESQANHQARILPNV
jgi:hypothetical protein